MHRGGTRFPPDFTRSLNFPFLCRLFVDLKRLSDPALRNHLQLDSPSKPELSIHTFPYESVYTELQAICAAHGPKDKVWICDKASCALTQVIPKVRVTTVTTEFTFNRQLIVSGVHTRRHKNSQIVSRLCFPRSCISLHILNGTWHDGNMRLLLSSWFKLRIFSLTSCILLVVMTKTK